MNKSNVKNNTSLMEKIIFHQFSSNENICRKCMKVWILWKIFKKNFFFLPWSKSEIVFLVFHWIFVKSSIVTHYQPKFRTHASKTENKFSIPFFCRRINKNKLEDLSGSLFVTLRNLETLDASDNSIKHLPLGLFRDNPKLKLLHFSRNKIKHISEGLFSKLEYLENLDISHNLLDTIPKFAFIDLVSLTRLHLGENGITLLPTGKKIGFNILKCFFDKPFALFFFCIRFLSVL